MAHNELLTPAQFHEALLGRGVRVDLVTIRRWCKAGKLGTKVAGRWYIRPEEINKVFAPQEPGEIQSETRVEFLGVSDEADGRSVYRFSLAAGDDTHSLQEVTIKTSEEFIMYLAVADRLHVRSDLLPQMQALLAKIRFDLLGDLLGRFIQTEPPAAASQRVGDALRWIWGNMPSMILTGTFLAMKMNASIPSTNGDLDVDLSGMRKSLSQSLISLQSMSPDEMTTLMEHAAGSPEKSRE